MNDLARLNDRAPIRLIVEASDRVGAVLGAALPGHARRRGAVVLMHGRGPGSPWCPADATIVGVVTACLDAAVATRWAPLGREPQSPGALAKLAAPASDRRTLPLRFDESSSRSWGLEFACELPRAWVGRHAVLLSPTVIESGVAGGAGPSCAGPFCAGLAALAVAAHARSHADPVEVGAAMLAGIFAGFTWVLDAHRALLRGPRAGARPAVAVVERVFVHGGTGLDASEIVERARVLDQWLRVRDASPSGIALEGAQATDPWPIHAREPVGVDGPVWSSRTGARGREARRP